MIESWFNTAERMEALNAEAKTWLGTPWMSMSDVKGAGVACHNLPRSILIAVGALPKNFPEIAGTMNQLKHARVSIMEQFLDGRSEFASVPVERYQPMAGDLIGIRICHVVDHLGIALDSKNFVHVLMHKNTCIDAIKVPPWYQRTMRAWRVKP